MKNFLVYILYDPRDENKVPRYVGITSRSLDQRLKEHIEIAKRGLRTYKLHWIRILLSEDVIPVIEQIDAICCSKEEAEVLENYYINKFLNEGFKITNCTKRNPESTVNVGKGSHNKSIIVLDRFTQEQLYVFESVKECSKVLGLSEGFISCCAIPTCNKKSSSKYVFVFEEDFNPEIDYRIPKFNTQEFHKARYNSVRNKLVEGAKKANSKPIAKLLDGEILEIYPSMQEAAKACNGIQANIYKVCVGERKTHRGFSWMYYEDIVYSDTKVSGKQCEN